MVSSNSIALRLSGMFTLVALVVFLLIGGALYQQVDKGLGLLPKAELDARYSVLESALNRFGTPEHWVKINAKLKLLGEEDKRIRFWVVSGIRVRIRSARCDDSRVRPRPAGHA